MEEQEERRKEPNFPLRLPHEIRVALDQAAKDERRSLNQEIITILEHDLIRRGYLPKSEREETVKPTRAALALG